MDKSIRVATNLARNFRQSRPDGTSKIRVYAVSLGRASVQIRGTAGQCTWRADATIHAEEAVALIEALRVVLADHLVPPAKPLEFVNGPVMDGVKVEQ